MSFTIPGVAPLPIPEVKSPASKNRPPKLFIDDMESAGRIIFLDTNPIVDEGESRILSTVNSSDSELGEKAAKALKSYLTHRSLRVGECLGGGSSSRVFKLEDPRGFPLVIKIIKLSERLIPWSSQKGEALTIGFDHPHLLTPLAILYYGGDTVSEQGKEGDRMIGSIMIEFPGVQLRDCMKQMKLLDVIRVGFQIAEALEYLHAKGVVHGDLNPSNVLLTTDRSSVVLADFGLSRKKNAPSSRGSPRGTEPYASPQRKFGNEKYRPQDDVFSLGMLLQRAYYSESGNPHTLPLKGEKGERFFRKLVAALTHPDSGKRLRLESAKSLMGKALYWMAN